jgi:hypothetical protein
VYDSMLALRIATPQVVLNYALMLQVGEGGGLCTRERHRWWFGR